MPIAPSISFLDPDRSAACRAPGFAYGWAYEAINFLEMARTR